MYIICSTSTVTVHHTALLDKTTYDVLSVGLWLGFGIVIIIGGVGSTLHRTNRNNAMLLLIVYLQSCIWTMNQITLTDSFHIHCISQVQLGGYLNEPQCITHNNPIWNTFV